MRPKIMPSDSVAKSLRYNEEKVTQKQAECILAANFLKDVDKLSFEDKLQRFERRMQLNENVTVNQHISLNFDPLDKLTNEKMQEIAQVYMKELGFEKQPYLVYRHHDAGHPHCHIVTTHVKANGDPIEMYNIGRNQSEKARLKIEAEFSLMTKEKKQDLRLQSQKLHGVPRVIYGEKPTARAVSDVLEFVTKEFKYTSLEELNAILRLYNVEAYRGKENTKLYQNHGLLYRVLDQHGKYIGVPLKASFFDCKPTLNNLEQKFAQNLSLKEKRVQSIKTKVHWELYQEPKTLEKLDDKLNSSGITMVIHKDKKNTIQRLAFVDFHSRCIVTEKDLDENTNSQAVQEVIRREQSLTAEDMLRQSQRHRHGHRL